MGNAAPIKTLAEVKEWLLPWSVTPPATPQTVSSAQFEALYVNDLFKLLYPDDSVADQKIEIADITVSFKETDGKLEQCILNGNTTQPFLGENAGEPVTFIFLSSVYDDLACIIHTGIGEWDWEPMTDFSYNLSIRDIHATFDPVLPAPAPEVFGKPEPEALINMSFSGKPAIGSFTLPEITIEVPSAAGPWAMLAEPKNGVSVTKEQLASLFAGHDIIQSLLVDYFQVDKLSFKRLYVTFNPNEPIACYLIQAAIAYAADWKPFGNDTFLVKELFFEFSLFNPFPGPPSALQALIGAKMTVAGTDLQVQALFNRDLLNSTTSVALSASVYELELSITGVFQFFHVPLPEGFPTLDVVIEEINFNILPQAKQVDFNLTVGKPVKITESIALDHFYFDLHADFNQSAVEAGGELYAIFTLGKTSLLLQGAYESTGAWSIMSRFTGLDAGAVITDIAAKFGISADSIPSVIKELKLNVLETSYSKQPDTSVFAFSLEGTTVIAGLNVEFSPKIKLTHKNEQWTPEFEGTLSFIDGEKRFTFAITINKGGDQTIDASYTDNAGALSLATLCSLFGFSPPSQLNASFQKIKFVYHYEAGKKTLFLDAESNPKKYAIYLYTFEKAAKWVRIFGMDLNLPINLADLPLIGSTIANKVKELDIRLLYASEALLKKEITLPPEIGLPADANGLPQGFSFMARVTFLNPSQVFDITSTAVPKQQGESLDIVAAPESGSTGQASIGKTIGPVLIEGINLNFSEGRLVFSFDVSFVFSGISMSFVGLSISNPINAFDPLIGLRGLGLSYSNGGVQIGGAFLATPIDGSIEYSGLVNIGLSQLKMLAMGAYAEVSEGAETHPSFFIYGLVSTPLGGPPFFFVTGLAAAIGYNRNILIPGIDKVKEFPLVKAVIEAQPGKGSVPTIAETTKMLAALRSSIPVSVGSSFFGLGVKFTTFKVVDSFVLLLLKFGKEVEVDILGISRYVAPAPDIPNPVAVVEFALVAQFIPAQGYAYVQGQLTPASFIFSRDCHLSGGFAIAVWAAGPHQGDFVYTFGGFGNRYTPPVHYPKNVTQLELLWKVDSAVTVKGGGYWAVDSHMIAAGGYLHASLDTSHLKAWFDLDASFIIFWKPFHYEASFSIDLGISVQIDLLVCSKWLTVDLSASMYITGPPFAGWASVDLCIITVTVHFGDATVKPAAIGWGDFAASFLPENKETVLQINVVNGLINQVLDAQKNEWYIINAKDLELEVQSVVPASDCVVYYQLGAAKEQIEISGNSTSKNAGITPMNLKTGDYEAPLELTIVPKESQTEHQVVAAILNEPAPAAIWGDGFGALDSDVRLVQDTRKGINLKAKPAVAAGSTAIESEELAWEWETFEDAFSFAPLSQPFATTTQSVIIPFGTPEPGANEKRNILLEAMGVSAAGITANDVSFDEKIDIGSYV
jgi:hypothetical protein